MNQDLSVPVKFILPKNDVASLITWEFVLTRMEQNLRPIMDSMEAINGSLGIIDTKLSEWVES